MRYFKKFISRRKYKLSQNSYGMGGATHTVKGSGIGVSYDAKECVLIVVILMLVLKNNYLSGIILPIE